MKIKYAILSRARAKWLLSQKRTTLSQIAHLNPDVYVRSDDLELYEYSIYCKIKGDCKPYLFEALAEDVEYYSQIYDMIIRDAILEGYDKVIILDDDLSFFMVNPIIGNKPDYKYCDPYEIKTLLNHMGELTCDMLPLVATARIESRSLPHVLNFNAAMRIAVCIHLQHVKDHPDFKLWQGINTEAHCDSYMSLRLMRDGFLTSQLATLYVSSILNNPGGCSTYRTLKLQETAINRLGEFYPDFTRLKNKIGWAGDPHKVIKGITFYWKKAFNKKMFQERFGVEANTFAKAHIKNYEKTYAEFIRGIRDADNQS